MRSLLKSRDEQLSINQLQAQRLNDLEAANTLLQSVLEDILARLGPQGEKSSAATSDPCHTMPPSSREDDPDQGGSAAQGETQVFGQSTFASIPGTQGESTTTPQDRGKGKVDEQEHVGKSPVDLPFFVPPNAELLECIEEIEEGEIDANEDTSTWDINEEVELVFEQDPAVYELEDGEIIPVHAPDAV